MLILGPSCANDITIKALGCGHEPVMEQLVFGTGGL